MVYLNLCISCTWMSTIPSASEFSDPNLISLSWTSYEVPPDDFIQFRCVTWRHDHVYLPSYLQTMFFPKKSFPISKSRIAVFNNFVCFWITCARRGTIFENLSDLNWLFDSCLSRRHSFHPYLYERVVSELRFTVSRARHARADQFAIRNSLTEPAPLLCRQPHCTAGSEKWWQAPESKTLPQRHSTSWALTGVTKFLTDIPYFRPTDNGHLHCSRLPLA